MSGVYRDILEPGLFAIEKKLLEKYCSSYQKHNQSVVRSLLSQSTIQQSDGIKSNRYIRSVRLAVYISRPNALFFGYHLGYSFLFASSAPLKAAYLKPA